MKAYSKSFKEKACERFYKSGLSLLEFSKTLGIPKSTLGAWVGKQKSSKNEQAEFVEIVPLPAKSVTSYFLKITTSYGAEVEVPL